MLLIPSLAVALLAGGAQTPPGEAAAHIYFERGSDRLNVAGLEIVEALASLPAASRGMLIVEGHTSTIGEAADNLALSQRRANAVRDALVATGIPADRITTMAFGESAPVRAEKDMREPLNDRVLVAISAPESAGTSGK
ncbi:MAG: OmpA family protein [Brevundimonas sp.]|jgi:outer membrane protein OmpA-like peptidoglycan-associated protein|uniref:OmpA family protein n=1 Tax=Brevundimonas sp. TaxID=1871086 RepID=UPI00182CEB49|nr:OmpA family protein [Brevundimonas sp.]MBA4805576.1 OmpA family protein [Brevundimonas sp.]